MFETAVLRKHGQGFTSVDAGLIAETLLFYSNVHVIAHFGVLIDLIKNIGADTLLRLIEDRLITLTYLRTDFGTASVTQNGIELHDFVSMRLGGTDRGKRKLTSHESVQLAFERALGKSSHTRRISKRFLNKIAVLQNIDVCNEPKGIAGLASADLDDPYYVQEAIKNSLVALVPSYVPTRDFRFGILRSSSGFVIDHNVDMLALNKKYKEMHPTSDVTLTPALLITQLIEARLDLQLCSRYMAELVTNPATASIVRHKLAALMAKRDKSVLEIEIFQSTHLRDARAIREAINSGEHTFDEFLVILEKAAKFKDWLRSRNPDANLLNEYYNEVMTETWINKLPAKGVRFLLALGLGAIIEAFYPSGLGAVSAVGLEAADYLLLDGLIRGWRPNQFVEGPLQRLAS